jgi:rare lipoprotein A
LLLLLLASVFASMLAACGSAPPAPVIDRDETVARPEAPAPRPATASSPADSGARRPGAFYKDDGPGDNPPPDLDRVADAVPRIEPLHRFANNPYNVFGKDYAPMRTLEPFKQSGIGSWYGKKFHGQKTSSGEIYDMYGMTAAHPTLPIPSYARVTNQMNGRSVVVRVNDRGPFHAGRVIDLSFAAAFKLGYVIAGSAPVQVELLQPDEVARIAARADVPAAPASRPLDTPAVATAPVTAEVARAAAPAGSVYLQLGAFSARDNAENFRARVYREVTWLSDAIEILQRDGIFRLHLGPYADRGQASAMAERLRRDIELAPVYVVR